MHNLFILDNVSVIEGFFNLRCNFCRQKKFYSLSHCNIKKRNDMALGKLYTLCKLSPSVITLLDNPFSMLSTSLRIYSHLVDHYSIPNQVSLGEDSSNLIPWAFLHREFEEKPWERRWESWAKFKEFLYFFFFHEQQPPYSEEAFGLQSFPGSTCDLTKPCP